MKFPYLIIPTNMWMISVFSGVSVLEGREGKAKRIVLLFCVWFWSHTSDLSIDCRIRLPTHVWNLVINQYASCYLLFLCSCSLVLAAHFVPSGGMLFLFLLLFSFLFILFNFMFLFFLSCFCSFYYSCKFFFSLSMFFSRPHPHPRPCRVRVRVAGVPGGTSSYVLIKTPSPGRDQWVY